MRRIRRDNRAAACVRLALVAAVGFANPGLAGHASDSLSVRVGTPGLASDSLSVRVGTPGLASDSLSVHVGTPGLASDSSWRDRPALPVAGDSVAWMTLRPSGVYPADLVNPPPARDGVPLWRVVAADSLRLAFQLHRLTRLRLSAGDTATAESCRVTLSRSSSLWRWEAVRGLVDDALARRDTARAESLLVVTRRNLSDVAESAECYAWLALLSAARGDTARAMQLSGDLIRAAPALPAAREALRLLDGLMLARGDTLDLRSQPDAAEVEVLAGDRAAAIRRLKRVFAARRDVYYRLRLDLWAVERRAGFRLAELQRLTRNFTEALTTLDSVRTILAWWPRSTRDSLYEPRVVLERARVYRDAGRADSAYALFQRTTRMPRADTWRELAWWELAQEAEQHGERARARRALAKLESLDVSRSESARVRLGLNWLADGGTDRARACFARGTSDAARFWWAITARDSSRGASDSVLTVLSLQPGYTFYSACARETLGVRGWPAGGRVAPADPSRSEAIDLMQQLIEAGLLGDAAVLITRWDGGDRGAGSTRSRPRDRPLAMERVAGYMYACGRYAPAIRIARRMLDAIRAGMPSDPHGDVTWALTPALYPPLYKSVIDSVARDRRIGIEPALFSAQVWKESHFDSAGVSRSGARGLTQLLPGAAADMARMLRETPPADTALTLPGVNLRYGARYLRMLIDRFGGSVPLALAAYNTGPRIVRDWPKPGGIGGDALKCEMVGYPETQDYVKSILAVRGAYRELRPYVAASPAH
ncbi:MAG: lytic transglycosylase domain-containing protein [Candidatus Eisenbacteria bacterium]|nr:lytic transglycosylase domain-containing protein [Candidatus Eisenbacteria bacterium]